MILLNSLFLLLCSILIVAPPAESYVFPSLDEVTNRVAEENNQPTILRTRILNTASDGAAAHDVGTAEEVAGTVTFDTSSALGTAELNVLLCQFSAYPIATYNVKDGYYCWFYSHPDNMCADGAIRFVQGPEQGELKGTSKWGITDAACYKA